jgi:hypothetical protein
VLRKRVSLTASPPPSSAFLFLPARREICNPEQGGGSIKIHNHEQGKGSAFSRARSLSLWRIVGRLSLAHPEKKWQRPWGWRESGRLWWHPNTEQVSWTVHRISSSITAKKTPFLAKKPPGKGSLHRHRGHCDRIEKVARLAVCFGPAVLP